MEAPWKAPLNQKKVDTLYRLLAVAFSLATITLGYYDSSAIAPMLLFLVILFYTEMDNLRVRTKKQEALARSTEVKLPYETLSVQLKKLWHPLPTVRKFVTLFLLPPISLFVLFLVFNTYRGLAALLMVLLAVTASCLDLNSQLIRLQLKTYFGINEC